MSIRQCLSLICAGFFLFSVSYHASALRFQAPVSYQSGSQAPYDVFLADMNLDSDLDLVTLADGKVSFLLGDGNGALLRENPMTTWGFSKATSSDFNGEGNFTAPFP